MTPSRRTAQASLEALLGAGVIALAWAACQGCAGSDPRALAYGAERLQCVQAHAQAEHARACMRYIDRAYGQDGGSR